MARLPSVGGDDGTWGVILNDFLTVSLDDDGALNPDTVGAAQLVPQSVGGAALADNAVTEDKLAAGVRAKLNASTPVLADGSVTTPKLADGAVTPSKIDGLGEAHGIASLSGDGRLPELQVPLRLSEGSLDAALSVKADASALSGYVPVARTVNGKPLSGDVTLDATDVSARPASWVPGWEDVAGKPLTFAPIIGTGTAEAAAGNDARLSDQRVPVDGSVSTTKIHDGAVTEAKLAPDLVALLDAQDGASAYDVAVEHGFEGSEEEWLTSLKGEKGESGLIRRTPLGALMRPFSGTHPSAQVTHTDDASATFPDPQGIAWSDERIRHLAGTPESAGPSYGCALRSTGATNPQSNYFGFHFNGTEFALHLTVWGTTDVTIYVDGLAATIDPYLVTGAGYQFVTVSNLPSGAHEVLCVVGWGSNFLQLVFHPDARVWPVSLPGFRFGLVGDSYADSGVAPYFAGLARELHRLTGWAPAQLGQGSTGYTNDASSEGPGTGKSVYGSSSRLSALATLDPDVVIVIGSVNDGSASPSAVKQAAGQYYAALAPRPVVVLGVEPIHSATDPMFATWDAINTATIEAASEAENVIGIIDWRNEDWLTGTGSVSAPTGDGNQDLFIGDPDGTDTVHPNYWGQRYLADRIVRAILTMEVKP